MLGRNAPHLLAPRLDVVFLSTLRTVSWDMVCTTLRRFNSSASRCNVQRARPSGGSLQAMATSCASPSPSSTGAITAALAASQRRFQPFLDTAFAHLFDRLAGDVKLVDDLPIMQCRTVLSLIGLQQDLCMAPTVGRRPSGLDQFRQLGPFLFTQTDHIELLHNHPSQLWPQLTGRQLIMPVHYVEQLLLVNVTRFNLLCSS